MALAHEIAMNDSFQLQHPEDKPENGAESLDPAENQKAKFEREVKKVVQQAFWDSIRSGIESDPPKFEHAFILLKEIKDILLSLLPKNRVTSIHKRIEESMDLDLFRQQAENDALNVHNIATFIIDTMATICAPARDEEVASLRSVEDIVDLFRQMHAVLEKMKIDYANFAIESVRPLIQKQQFEYERASFAKLVQNSPDGLKKTHQWISATRQDIEVGLSELAQKMALSTKVSEEASNGKEVNEDEMEKIRKAALSPMSVLKSGFTQLLTWDYAKNNFPETLQMDKERFEALKQQLEQLILISAAMVTACSVFSNPLASHRAFLIKMKNSLMAIIAPQPSDNAQDLLSRVSLQVWKDAEEYVQGKGPEVERCITEAKKPNLDDKIKALSSKESHPVYGLLHKRAVDYLASTADILSQRTSVSPTGLPAVPAGLSYVADEIAALGQKYGKLVSMNQMVYGPFYVAILRDVLGLLKSPTGQNSTEGKELNSEAENGSQSTDAQSQEDKPGLDTKDANTAKKVYKVTGSLADLD